MLKRGLKRKNPGDKVLSALSSSSSDYDDESYARNYSNFQIAARTRESLRLKSQAISADGNGGGAASQPGAVERQLKDKLSVEMSLVEGTAKFIMACKNKRQTLEAAKTLLTARLRVGMLNFDLRKFRNRGTGIPEMKQQGKPSYAALSLSHLRIPLMWRRKDHINDVGDPRRFAVFCVARIGSQIYDTGLVEPIDRHSTDITLPDVLVFNKVPPYFELNLEVYGHLLEKELAGGISSTPQKIARSISRAVGRSIIMGNNKRSAMKDFETVGPKFELIASATLTLDQCDEDIQSHELYVESPDLGDQGQQQQQLGLPLFGQFCCRLAGLPYCCEDEVMQGHLDLKKFPGKKDASQDHVLLSSNLKIPGMFNKNNSRQRKITSKCNLLGEGVFVVGGNVPKKPRLSKVVFATCGDQNDLDIGKMTLENGDTDDDEDEHLGGRNIECTRLWASLMDWNLSLWQDKSHKDENMEPAIKIPINGDTRIEDRGSDTLSITNGRACHEFYFEEKENLHSWLVHLIQHAQDHRRWKKVSEQRMKVLTPESQREEAEDCSLMQPSLAMMPSMMTLQRSQGGRSTMKRTKSKLVVLYNQTGN